MKKAVFFGCNGYLGSHLVNRLKSQGYFITGFDIQNCTELKSIDLYYKIDISNIEDIKNIDFDVDYVYYFSGIAGTNISLENYNEFIDINEKGLLNVLTTIKNKNVFPKVIFPSTRLVYKGVKNKALKEDSSNELKTIYALNKFHNENCLKLFKDYFNIPYTIFRICIPFGNIFSNYYSYGTIGFFLSQAQKGKPITLYGDGNLKRTFTFVLDICEQIVSTSQLNISNGEVYNISGETFSLLEIANLISKKYTVEVKHVDWPPLALALESGDTIFDSTKIDKITINNNRVSLKDWINNL
jgi:UDP-glucose 4-epimerase